MSIDDIQELLLKAAADVANGDVPEVVSDISYMFFGENAYADHLEGLLACYEAGRSAGTAEVLERLDVCQHYFDSSRDLAFHIADLFAQQQEAGE